MQIDKQKLARQILGEKVYEGVCTLFLRVLNRCIQYEEEGLRAGYFIVCITRRCNVLWENLWLTLQEEDSQDKDGIIQDIQKAIRLLGGLESGSIMENYRAFKKKHYVTDVAFRSMSGHLVEHYYYTNELPKIILVDELLIHGRGINGFLYGMEESLREQYARLISINAKNDEKDANQICKDFVDALTLDIYAVNRNDRLLLSRYAERLVNYTQFTRAEWREISMRFAQYISVGEMSNVGFSWSLHYKDGFASLLNELKDVNGPFHSITTALQGIEQRNFLFFYPDEKKPKLTCTIRFKRNAFDEIVCVPYIMYDHLVWENIYELHKHFCKEAISRDNFEVAEFLQQNDWYIESDIEENKKYYLRWISETNDLILSNLLMRKFIREVIGDADWTEHRQKYLIKVDYSQLLPNYRLHFQTDEEDIADIAVEKLWNWDGDLEKYFDLLLKDSRPFWQGRFLPEAFSTDSLCTQLKSDDPIVFAVEDTVAQIGIQAEYNAYIRYSGNTILSDRELISWGDNYSLEATLKSFHKILHHYTEDMEVAPNLYQVFAVIMQAMDLGLIGMSTVLSQPPAIEEEEPTSENPEIYTRQRAGEASLFILPIRYKEFLPKLKVIVERYSEYPRILSSEIDELVEQLLPKRFFAPDDWKQRPHRSSKIMKDRLKYFVGGLMQSGQNFQEWDFALEDYAEGYKHSLLKITN